MKLQVLQFLIRVQVAVCGLRCVDLKTDTLKILGTHLSYNEKLKDEIWKMRNLTLEWKIVIFKTLAISKIVFQSLVTPVPRHIVNGLEKIQKAFLWKNSSTKIKHETLCNDCNGRGLENIDILNKVISLQCS